MKIDAVEQGAGQTAEISYTLPYRTGAAVTVAIVAAGAGIGSGHQHEGGRIFHLPAKARNDDLPVFHRPPQGLHHTLGHLRELVGKKYPVVSQGDLPGHYVSTVASTDEGSEGCAVVGSTERPAAYQAGGVRHQPGNRVYLAGNQRLLQRHWRQDSGYGLGDGTFPSARGTDENQVVPAADRHFGRPLGRLLPDYLRKIHISRRSFRRYFPVCIDFPVPDEQVFAVLSLQDREHLGEIVHPVNLRLPQFHRLHGGLSREDAAAKPHSHGHLGIRQGPRDRTDRTVQAQFAHYQVASEPRQISLCGGGYNAQGYGQVVAAAVLVQVGRREVDYYLLSGNMKVHGLKGRHRAEQTLLYGCIRQPHEMNSYTSVDFDLDDNRDGIDPYAFGTNNIYQHNSIITIFAGDAALYCHKKPFRYRPRRAGIPFHRGQRPHNRILCSDGSR